MDETLVAFVGHEQLSTGPAATVAVAVKRYDDAHPNAMVAVLNAETGRVVDLDLTGSEADVARRMSDGVPRRAGRPRLGVVSREVSLLPRHWSWLSTQRGGASATLRRLVDEARKSASVDDLAQQTVDRVHRFLWNVAGDLPGFEEASRCLFRFDLDAFDEAVADWPADVVAHVGRMMRAYRGAGSA